MRFEWDSKNNRINQAKHDGLSFEIASHGFDDSNLILMKDRVIEGEQRWQRSGALLRLWY
jgi:uncharacterized DUF497 family protein